jgi:uncharacterized protein YeaO (DUF488 family)
LIAAWLDKVGEIWMKIYTSYYSKIPKLHQAGIIPVSVSLSVPKSFTGQQIRTLAPNWNILSEYKLGHDEQLYTQRYRAEILDKLSPHKLITALNKCLCGKDVALLCYEKPNDFCHRHLIAYWLGEAGYAVQEFGLYSREEI